MRRPAEPHSIRRAALFAAAVAVLALPGCGGGDEPPKQPSADVGDLTPSTTPERTETTPPPEPKQEKPEPAEPASSLDGATILVNPGHNGGNVNATSEINRMVDAGGFQKACDTTGTATDDDSLTESAFNLAVGLKLRDLLEQQGAKVVMTRDDDEGVGPCIDERAAIGNRAKADAALSIHADGAPSSGHGFHIILPATNEVADVSRRLGEDIRSELDDAGLERSTYVGQEGLDPRTDIGGLNLSEVPAILLETGNMKNAGDAAQLADPAFQEKVAQAMLDGTQKFLEQQ